MSRKGGHLLIQNHNPKTPGGQEKMGSAVVEHWASNPEVLGSIPWARHINSTEYWLIPRKR